MSSTEGKTTEVLHVTFNQDYGCIAVGTQNGFIIYNSDPLKERFRRDFGGGIGIVEMLFRCNILALVGGGRNPMYPPTKVMLWDDYQNKCIAELEFRSEVKAVRLRKDKIVVALEERVYVYNFADLRLLKTIDTAYNPRGLLSLSPVEGNSVLACPKGMEGEVHVEFFDVKPSLKIAAHTSALSQIVLNLDGSLLATASEKGTLVRIHNTSDGTRVREVRRGVDRAEIYCLAFSPTSAFLTCSSDKGTVHIYSVFDSAKKPGAQEVANRQSSFSFMKDLLPSYFSSEWSFSQFKVSDSHPICAFGADKDTVIAVCRDGKYFKYVFDPQRGGEAREDGVANFLKDDIQTLAKYMSQVKP